MVQPTAALCSASVQLVSSTVLSAEYSSVSENCHFATYTLDWHNKTSTYTHAVSSTPQTEEYSDVWLVCVMTTQYGLNATVCHKFPLQDCNYYSDSSYYYYCVANNGPSLVDAIIVSLIIWAVYAGYGYILKTITVTLMCCNTIFLGKIYSALLVYLQSGVSVSIKNQKETPTYLSVKAGDKQIQEAMKQETVEVGGQVDPISEN
jgi:hypothetical protein